MPHSHKATKVKHMRNYVKSALAASGIIFGLSSIASAYQPQTPDVYVVMFRADYCAPCKVVEPALNQALTSLRDPRIEYVHIDIGAGQGERNAHLVFDKGIVQQYNMWLGVTGFAAIIDGDTKQTLGCINLNYDSSSMASHIKNLQTLAQSNTSNFDITCPAPNNPV